MCVTMGFIFICLVITITIISLKQLDFNQFNIGYSYHRRDVEKLFQSVGILILAKCTNQKAFMQVFQILILFLQFNFPGKTKHY